MATDRTIAVAVSLLLCCLSTLVSGQTDFYLNNSIIPDLLTAPPPEILSVLYRGGVSVIGGSTLDPRKLRDPPMFSWEFEEGKKYTLLMMDIDVLGRESPIRTALLHFLVMNITGNDVYRSDVVCDYWGPSPLPFTGMHRYCFLLYEETPNTPSPAFTDRWIFRRFDFNLNKFIEDFQLIGAAKAGNCFLAEFKGI